MPDSVPATRTLTECSAPCVLSVTGPFPIAATADGDASTGCGAPGLAGVAMRPAGTAG